MAEAGISGDDRILSNYIDSLAAKALGLSRPILPRVPALFEPISHMPGILDAGTAEDRPVGMIPSADDINRPLARDSSPGPASENSLNIESSFKPAINPIRKTPDQIADSSHEGLENAPIKRQDIAGRANPGGPQGQMIHFEQASGSIGVDQVSIDVEASQRSQVPNRNTQRNTSNGQKLGDTEAGEAIEDAGSFEPVVEGTVVEVMPGFKNGKESDEPSVIKNIPLATKEAAKKIIEEATGDINAYEHANMGNESPNMPSSELDQKQTISILEDIDIGAIKSVVEGVPRSDESSEIKIIPRTESTGRSNPEGNDIKVFQHGQTPDRNADGNRKRPSETVAKEANEEAIGDAKAYEHASLGYKLPPVTSSKLDRKQTIADSMGSDITIIKPLIDGEPDGALVSKSSKMSADKFQINHKPLTDLTQPGNLPKTVNASSMQNISKPPEITSPPVVKVTIGRIEVKAVLPPDKKVQRPAPKAKSTSLEKYLHSIRGGSR